MQVDGLVSGCPPPETIQGGRQGLLTFRFPVDPLLELDGGDLPFGRVRLQLRLERLPHDPGGDVGVLDVAAKEGGGEGVL